MAGTTTTNTVEIIVFQPIPNELCYFFMENRISEKEFSVVVSHLLPNVVAFRWDQIRCNADCLFSANTILRLCHHLSLGRIKLVRLSQVEILSLLILLLIIIIIIIILMLLCPVIIFLLSSIVRDKTRVRSMQVWTGLYQGRCCGVFYLSNSY